MRNNKKITQLFNKTLTASALMIALGSSSAFAADGNSTVKGNIVNSQGADLNNAQLVFTHKSKGLVFTVQTNSKGEYLLRNLPVGRYSVAINKLGFETVIEQDVALNIGQAMILDAQLLRAEQDIERIAVTGTAIRRVDMASSTAGVTFTDSDLKVMPVNTGFESIALLAPGTAQPGGSNFKGASSFGGSSAAENGYYFNGLNVTSIQTGLGSIRLPWEAISQTQVKTGGISPEFGGALGGIVNAVSKSGDNEFKFGAEVHLDPSFSHDYHDSNYQDNGTININTQQDYDSFRELQLWASGALIEDSLFYYGLICTAKGGQPLG